MRNTILILSLLILMGPGCTGNISLEQGVPLDQMQDQESESLLPVDEPIDIPVTPAKEIDAPDVSGFEAQPEPIIEPEPTRPPPKNIKPSTEPVDSFDPVLFDPSQLR